MLGELILDETGTVTGTRVLSNDASGTKLEVSLRTTGRIQGVSESCLWTYWQLIRPDGSVYGQGEGVMTTQDGDVLQMIGHGSGQAPPPGGTMNFRTMLHVYTTSEKFAILNRIGLVGNYDVEADGSAVNKCWEWK
jgi:hypothetical protein